MLRKLFSPTAGTSASSASTSRAPAPKNTGQLPNGRTVKKTKALTDLSNLDKYKPNDAIELPDGKGGKKLQPVYVIKNKRELNEIGDAIFGPMEELVKGRDAALARAAVAEKEAEQHRQAAKMHFQAAEAGQKELAQLQKQRDIVAADLKRIEDEQAPLLVKQADLAAQQKALEAEKAAAMERKAASMERKAAAMERKRAIQEERTQLLKMLAEAKAREAAKAVQQ
jgi:hypothetical protein